MCYGEEYQEYEDPQDGYYTWIEKCPQCGAMMECWELNDHTAAGEHCTECDYMRLI